MHLRPLTHGHPRQRPCSPRLSSCTTGKGRNRGEFEYSLQAGSLSLPQRAFQNLGFFEHIVLLQQEPRHWDLMAYIVTLRWGRAQPSEKWGESSPLASWNSKWSKIKRLAILPDRTIAVVSISRLKTPWVTQHDVLLSPIIAGPSTKGRVGRRRVHPWLAEDAEQ